MPCRATGCCHIVLLFGNFLHEVLRLFDGTQICAHRHLHHTGKAQLLHRRDKFTGGGMFTKLTHKGRGNDGDHLVALEDRLDHLEYLALIHNRAERTADQALAAGYTFVLVDFGATVLIRLNGIHAAGALARALALTPTDHYDLALSRQTRTDDAKRLINAKGYPAFSASELALPAADRAYKGAQLSTRELIDVAALFRSARALVDYINTDKPFETSLDELFGRLMPNRTLEDKITRSILSEELILPTSGAKYAPQITELRILSRDI